MNVSSVSSNNTLLKQLEASGLSATKAKLVASDLATSEKTGSTGTSAAGLSPSVRATFDAKIASDVSSGKLSASDAAAVKKTMDGLAGGSGDAASAAQGSTGAATSPQAGRPAGGGGGGGGGSSGSNKTELSESITISGSTMTTVITYTDGTTSTTTTTATDADKTKYDKNSSIETSAAKERYAPGLEKGSLVDQLG